MVEEKSTLGWAKDVKCTLIQKLCFHKTVALLGLELQSDLLGLEFHLVRAVHTLVSRYHVDQAITIISRVLIQCSFQVPDSRRRPLRRLWEWHRRRRRRFVAQLNVEVERLEDGDQRCVVQKHVQRRVIVVVDFEARWFQERFHLCSRLGKFFKSKSNRIYFLSLVY